MNSMEQPTKKDSLYINVSLVKEKLLSLANLSVLKDDERRNQAIGEVAESIYENCFRDLKDGSRISFKIPRLDPEDSHILWVFRKALEKRFGQEKNHWYGTSLMVSELMDNAFDHGEGDEVELEFQLTEDRFIFLVSGEARNFLDIRENDGVNTVHFNYKRDIKEKEEGKQTEEELRRKIDRLNTKVNDCFATLQTDFEKDQGAESYVLKPKKDHQWETDDEEEDLLRYRSRGICVISGYLTPTDELMVVLRNNGETAMGISRDRKATIDDGGLA